MRFEKNLCSGLTLRELEALAGTGLAGLFAFTGTWVTAEETSGLQVRAEFRIMKNQRTGDGQLDGISLSVETTSFGNSLHIELVAQIGNLKWLEKLTLKGESGENFFKRVLIDGDLSGSGSDPDAGHSGLTTSGGGKSFAHYFK